MSENSTAIRDRVEAQGFLCLTDTEIDHFKYWFRLAPAICLAWTAVGVALASPKIHYALVPFAILGAVLRTHPFDLIYEWVYRFYDLLAPAMPSYGTPRRFACLMASVMLATTATLFQLELWTAGYVLGGTMIVMAGIQVFTGFCVPSFIYRTFLGRVANTAEDNA